MSQVLRDKGIGIKEDHEELLILFSKELAEDRLPSFYFERFHTEEEATQFISKGIYDIIQLCIIS